MALWQKGFRSVVILTEAACWGKVQYIEMNPVRAGICLEPEQYRWSSLHLVSNGCIGSYGELDLEAALAFYKAA